MMYAMTPCMFVFLFNSTIAQAKECEELKRDMKALELFLQDQEDYEKYCSKIKWKQPGIEVYKKELKSELPKDCKE